MDATTRPKKGSNQKRKGFLVWIKLRARFFEWRGSHNIQGVVKVTRTRTSGPLSGPSLSHCQASNWRRDTVARCDMGRSRWAATAWTAWGSQAATRTYLHGHLLGLKPVHGKIRAGLGNQRLRGPLNQKHLGRSRTLGAPSIAPGRFAATATSRLIQEPAVTEVSLCILAPFGHFVPSHSKGNRPTQ